MKEVLLALNATVEGQSTAHYLTEQLQGRGVTVTRLAQGVPIGGELDYLDEGTLAAAIKSRRRPLIRRASLRQARRTTWPTTAAAG